MQKPVLVVLAAGMGSRYGGLKQIDPVGPDGEVIIDYSVYDALQAGFEKVVFIIKRAIEKDFKEAIGNRIARYIGVEYAYQELDMLPAGFSVPPGREKPWGTSHALLAAKDLIHGPFTVINADDYYGPAAYKTIFSYLAQERPLDGVHNYCMVGYNVENTVTDKGTVTRGVCERDDAGNLSSIVERMKVEKTAFGARYTEDDGETWVDLPEGTLVSMNFWGFDETFLAAIERGFPKFLKQNLPVNPLKCEYLLPRSVDMLIRAGEARVKVLASGDVWHGVTYKEDKPTVVAAIAQKHKEGLYPTPLWQNL